MCNTTHHTAITQAHNAARTTLHSAGRVKCVCSGVRVLADVAVDKCSDLHAARLVQVRCGALGRVGRRVRRPGWRNAPEDLVCRLFSNCLECLRCYNKGARKHDSTGIAVKVRSVNWFGCAAGGGMPRARCLWPSWRQP